MSSSPLFLSRRSRAPRSAGLAVVVCQNSPPCLSVLSVAWRSEGRLSVSLGDVFRDKSKLAVEHAVDAIQDVVDTTGRRGVAMFFAGAVRAEQLLRW